MQEVLNSNNNNQTTWVNLNIMLSERRKIQKIYIEQGYAFPKKRGQNTYDRRQNVASQGRELLERSTRGF